MHGDGDGLVDVAVVGVGPVGATALNLLGQAGLHAEGFELGTDVFTLPRAAHFDAEVMRVFQGLGLADAVRPATTEVVGMHFVDADGRTLLAFDAPDQPGPHGWPAGFMFYQPDLERALRAGIERYPSVGLHLGHEVVALDQHADRVDLSVRDRAGGAERTVGARWVLGCDGARSSVRRGAGIGLDDLAFDQPWLVVDVVLRREGVDLPAVVEQRCDPARPATFVPSAGAHRRWEFMLMPGETAEEMERPETIRALLEPWLDPDGVEIIRSAVYTFHALVAERWRDRRALLVGDAAHQTPPFLGQGMCAGIRDAANLVWKLRLVRDGVADDSILDTYQTEREPHVRRLVGLAVELGQILQTTDPALAAARDEQLLARREAAGSGGEALLPPLPPLGDGLLQAGGRDEPLAVGTPLPQPRVRTAGGGVVRLDDILGLGFAVLCGPGVVPPGDVADAASWSELGAVVLGVVPPGDAAAGSAGVVEDLDGWVHPWLTGDRVVLVRPDRYVFGWAHGPDARRELTASLRSRLRPGR
ncbi:MAG: bifunctional 3-(3-hydroxy-phenyl)propionate/3-hydroxycinnamic acid hydroxylase [Acidimicrobiales bacterium]|nr:bifunctional 3-(3-hydroxy-phenyl)propionate/3-hydroxycinnamic acid hydroxylase [Acidimicrobiales bacterium]